MIRYINRHIFCAGQDRTPIVGGAFSVVSVPKNGKRTTIVCIATAILLLLTIAPWLVAQTVRIASTPPMGWNSWNHFGKKVTDADVRATADALVTSGMRNAGYIYVNIDDGWEGERDSQGIIHPNSRFPDMKALADYVHSKKLKLGIYSSPGPQTCGGYAGSYGHEVQDAKTYASWGIDYLKYDNCTFGKVMQEETHGDRNKEAAMQKAAYEKMHRALVATGRQIVFSVGQLGWDNVWEWGSEVGGNLWRTTGDIRDNYSRMAEIGFSQAGLARFASPGHWNDPDMLEIGNGGMTEDEYRTHMTLWVMLAAPLLAGNDLSNMTPGTVSLLTNKEVIAVDQDKLGEQGDRIWQEGPLQIWVKRLSDGSKAVALFNNATQLGARSALDFAAPITLRLHDIGFDNSAEIRDLWSGQMVSAKNGLYTTFVPKHGSVLLKISK